MAPKEEKVSYRSGFVAILGRPNVGKSTLVNALVGQKVAITSPKPQTTRHRILGVRHMDGGQLVLLDTPGFHKAKGGLNRVMVDAALGALDGADLVYMMLEVSPKFLEKPDIGKGNRILLDLVDKVGCPVFAILNKVDLIDKNRLLPFIEQLQKDFDFTQVIPISALENDGVDLLADLSMPHMPEGPAYFEDDTYTDRTLRFLVEEIVREKLFQVLEQELPYAVAVQVEQFIEPTENKKLFEIRAAIHVERESQKGIVIGKGGQTIKTVGSRAREDIRDLLGRDVFLGLQVKLSSGWTTNERLLNSLGYSK